MKEYIDLYLKTYTPYQTYWNYEDGCVLMGALQLFQATGDSGYMDYIRGFIGGLIPPDGVITNYEAGKFNIDGFNCGKVLFGLYEHFREERFRKAIDFLFDNLMKQPRTKSGSFWHKAIYPDQIWLDGLYMAQPFYMEYETKYNQKANYNDILGQFRNVRRLMWNEQKQLYYHAYDERREMFWADKETGCSKNFWLRSIGWYLMALIDVIDNMSEELYEHYRELIAIFKEALDGVLKYRDGGSGLFFQVVNQPYAEGNYTETSGSAMVAYAVMKAARLGVISLERYAFIGIDIFDSLVREKLVDGRLVDICKVAGLGPADNPARDGSVAYYLSEPKTENDAKGTGPFMMAYAQKLMLVQKMQFTQ